MKNKIIVIIYMFVLMAITAFAQDGQIDIDKLIERKEFEQQKIEEIGETLREITKKAANGEVKDKIKDFLKNEDDEIVKFDDSSDEINLDYFINLFNDNSARRKIKEIIDKFAEYIKNTNKKSSNNADNSLFSIPYYSITISICMLFSLIICSISTVNGKEASNFSMIKEENNKKLEDIDKQINKIEEKQTIAFHRKRINKPEKKVTISIENSLEESYEYNSEVWQQIAQQAITNLGSYSGDEEFKNVYIHYKKRVVLSGRPVEDALNEVDSAEKALSDITDKDNSLLNILIKSKNATKYAGNDINNVNSLLIGTDLAYLSTLSDNFNSENKDKANEFWSANAWV